MEYTEDEFNEGLEKAYEELNAMQGTELDPITAAEYIVENYDILHNVLTHMVDVCVTKKVFN